MKVSLEEFHHQLSVFEDGLPSAEVRYQQYCDFDPYPEISPSLLSAGHAASYIMMCGMIEEFDVKDFNKPATLSASLDGPVRFRDGQGKLHSFELTDDVQRNGECRNQFILKPNSICYVTLKPFFQIPDYIGMRFNLTIRDVYRGLLVGTGPIVDPGFRGHLSLPIHNLTNNEYVLSTGEPFVYFEFTKLSWENPSKITRQPSWFKPPIDAQPPFPSSKNKRQKLDQYLNQATSSGAAQSSISRYEILLNQTQNLYKWSWVGAGVALITIIIGITSLIFAAFEIHNSAISMQPHESAETTHSLQTLEDKIDMLEQQIKNLGVQSDPSD